MADFVASASRSVLMRKSTITKTWIAGIVAIALGFVAAAVATGLMLAYGGTFTSAPSGSGYDFVPAQDAFFWTMVGVIITGFVVASAGAIVQFVAWIGAIVNSYQLQDKLWFVLTLILGLIGFGLVMMIVYLIAAPDGYEEKARTAGTQAPLPPALAPTT
jgi:hypothetical protein